MKKVLKSDGTAMVLSDNYADNLPGTDEAIKANNKACEQIDIFKMELNTLYGVAGQETYF